MVHVALIGTRGVPARYGGFETAVEEVGRRLVERGHDVTVYCRMERRPPREHLGMRLVHVPAIRSKTMETLSRTALSVLHAQRRRPDAAVIFNAANAPLLPMLRAVGVPTAVHVDGLEWQRAKWGPTGRRYYLRCERLAVRWADALIADARGIQDHYRNTYGAATRFVPYGAPVLRDLDADGLEGVGARPRGYHLVVARLEPENHVDVIVDGYRRSGATLPLVVVGDTPYGQAYAERVRGLAAGRGDVRFVGSVWDQDLLNRLYAHATSYLHGHSVGGTNPSLLRAMGAGAPVIAYDVVFNREVTGPHAELFVTADDVAARVTAAEADPMGTVVRGLRGQERVARRYTWEAVTDGYETLCLELAERRPAERPRRTTPTAPCPADAALPDLEVSRPGDGSSRRVIRLPDAVDSTRRSEPPSGTRRAS